jgi:hypothetical protein
LSKELGDDRTPVSRPSAIIGDELGEPWRGRGGDRRADDRRRGGVHALVPGLFTETAGRTVVDLHEHMTKRKAGAANPNAWPDYEI